MTGGRDPLWALRTRSLIESQGIQGDPLMSDQNPTVWSGSVDWGGIPMM